jgi:hypothetical protein
MGSPTDVRLFNSGMMLLIAVLARLVLSDIEVFRLVRVSELRTREDEANEEPL